jgi:hypothetical protein
MDDFVKMLSKHAEEDREVFQKASFLIDGLRYELFNHEYCITGDTRDTVACFDGVVDTESQFFKDCLREAIILHNKEIEE